MSYPKSPLIKSLAWEPASEMIRTALGKTYESGKMDGSDNWPLTWADDGKLYTAYGDGYGFDPILPEKLGLGFASVEGDPPGLTCVNIRSSGENKGSGRKGKKGSGILMVDGVLYLWLFHANEAGAMCQLARSGDHGRSWTYADWMFEPFGLCTFINFGKNYQGARDGYVYTVSHDGPNADGPADTMVLMRVPKEKIMQRDCYEFYQGMKGGEPVFTREISERGAVFINRDACLRSGISFNAPLGRYLWWQHTPNPPGHPDRGDTRFAGGFAVYEAPEPWGPWAEVYATAAWDIGPGERAEFPPKWISADGLTMYLAFSGDDNFCVRKATLTLR